MIACTVTDFSLPLYSHMYVPPPPPFTHLLIMHTYGSTQFTQVLIAVVSKQRRVPTIVCLATPKTGPSWAYLYCTVLLIKIIATHAFPHSATLLPLLLTSCAYFVCTGTSRIWRKECLWQLYCTHTAQAVAY